ncbi:cysteine peptidase inhibitor [Trypanosoma theileri]|uniref:Cysteine peptidase inhibitor n=1 Tax=Trypanosoma theileri TaxID=67003 RepID=A0A1X0NX79_9TRYP|nr:cysteine peptidase inhibitor [Trypanosoma theileri]ORC88819.1 cysteine peptidase inhibitor [Trypanosoma theileri]
MADNGKNISVAVGESFEVELASNPTTGFTWALEGNDKKQLPAEATGGGNSFSNNHFHVKREYIHPDTRLLGAGGTDRFRVTPRVPGEHELVLVYARSWEAPDPNAKRFRVRVRVA